MLIQEVILENFMSYEYARVPFKQGVNVIGGPNGAGKSSLAAGNISRLRTIIYGTLKKTQRFNQVGKRPSAGNTYFR